MSPLRRSLLVHLPLVLVALVPACGSSEPTATGGAGGGTSTSSSTTTSSTTSASSSSSSSTSSSSSSSGASSSSSSSGAVFACTVPDTCPASPPPTAVPMELASAPQGCTSMFLDGGFLYYLTDGSGISGTLARVPVAGGTATTIATGLDHPNNLVVAGGRAYWNETGRIATVDVNGGATTSFAIDGSGRILGIALEPSTQTLVWAHFGLSTGDAVRAQKLGGGAMTTLAELPADTFSLYQMDRRNIAADADGVYFAGGALVGRVGLDGQGLTILAQKDPSCAGASDLNTVASDATYVYWYDKGSSTTYRIAKAGGQPEVLDPKENRAFDLVLDAGGIYKSGYDTIEKTPIAGGCPITLAANQPAPILARALAIDVDNIYWSDASSQNKPMKIWKLPR